MRFRFLHVLAICLLAVVVIAPANANSIIPTYITTTFDSGTGLYDYQYDLNLSGSAEMNPALNAAFETFFDFAGFDHATAPVNWTVTSMLTGGAGFLTAPTDSATIMNVQFTYTGPTVNGPQDLGIFNLYSTVGTTTPFDQYTGQDTNNQSLQKQGNIGLVTGPNAVVTPETSTYGMIGMGLVGVFMIRRRVSLPNQRQ